MEKVTKKEIRVVFNLKNENDKELYNRLREYPQPSKIIKETLFNHLNKTNRSVENDNVNLELIKVINKLSDKLDNLTLASSDESIKSLDEVIEELSFTEDVSSDDLDDIEF